VSAVPSTEGGWLRLLGGIISVACLLALLGGCGGSAEDEVPDTSAVSTLSADPTRDSGPTGDPTTDSNSDPDPGDNGGSPGDTGNGDSGNDNLGIGDYTVRGTAYDQRGRPLAGVEIYIYIIPRRYGALYRTETGSDGRYSYQVPEGVYQVLAEIYPADDEPEIGEDLVPIGEDNSITVPPSQVINFQLP
jgi:hypothetical protein